MSHRYRALTLRQATTKAHTILEEAAPFYEEILQPMGIGRTSLRQATTRRTQSMRWLLLSTTWGLTLGPGLCCESAERVLTFATQHRQQTTSPSPQLLI